MVNLDKLTYAGNLENLRDVESDPRYRFVHGDICDRAWCARRWRGWTRSCTSPPRPTWTARTWAPTTSSAPTSAAPSRCSRRRASARSAASSRSSTDEVYGSIAKGAARERDPLNPSNPYSASKAAADLLARAYWTTHRLPVLITRSSNNFGPYQYPEKVIPLFVTNAIEDTAAAALRRREERARLALRPRQLRGHRPRAPQGQGRRDLQHRRQPRGRERGADPAGSCSLLGKPESLITPVADRPGHDRRYALDSGKIRRARLDARREPFDAALAATVEWYAAHEAWWKPIKSGAFRAYYQTQYTAEITAMPRASIRWARRRPARPGRSPRCSSPRRDAERRPGRTRPRSPRCPSHIARVEPAVVGIRVEVPADRPSAATLGTERWGSGVIFEPPGYVLTVSYVLLDAARIEVTLRDGRKVPAELVGLDLESGLGVVKLDGPGPWPAAALGDSTQDGGRRRHGHGGRLDDGGTSWRRRAGPGGQALRRRVGVHAGPRLHRGARTMPAFGGAALVDATGAVDRHHLAAPRGGALTSTSPSRSRSSSAGKDELLAQGRVDEPRARGPGSGSTRERSTAAAWSWPASRRSARRARRASGRATSSSSVNGRRWRARRSSTASSGRRGRIRTCRYRGQRAARLEAITVRPVDRYRFYRTSDEAPVG